MAIKKRLLESLSKIMTSLTTPSTNLKQTVNLLTEARALSKKGLPERFFEEYAEVYDGVIGVLTEMYKDSVEAASFMGTTSDKTVPSTAKASGNAVSSTEKNTSYDDTVPSPEKSDSDEVISLVRELITALLEKTKAEANFKKEIVFLPYKASMWDSLESVWRAAADDTQQCITYVAPIPYCDKNPDGSPREWHYEGGAFPEYVPITDWQKIDLAAMRPDVIFIHAPYDAYNYVTSVDSRFYSSELAKHTEKLVYIPYFVLNDPTPGNTAAEEKIAHFITVPAVFNADYTIVQSEPMREVYVNVLTRHTEIKNRDYWEKKILGLGSPKFDKVLTSRPEDFELPPKWAKLIRGKKVILYNTSLDAMLNNTDKICEKMRYVFDVFKRRRDVVLWWRPHPLMKATMKSMRPQILAEYEAIERDYIRAGWGVYDDTAELNRAIAVSDAYYGDPSSVVHLYRATGKPILIQDVNLKKSVDREKIGFMVAYVAVENRSAWFISSRDVVCALYRMNLDTDEVSFLGELPTSYKTAFEYSTVVKIGGKIIIAPCMERESFIEYDISRGTFTKIEDVKNSLTHISPGVGAFSNVVAADGSAFFIGEVIVEYNGDTARYICHTEWVNKLKGIKKSQQLFAGMAFAQVGNTVYIPIVRSKYILEFTLPDCSVNVHEIPFDFTAGRAVYDGEYVWLTSVTSKDSVVVRWDIQRNEFSKIHLTDDSKYLFSIGNIVCLEKKILFFPVSDGRTLFEINRDSGVVYCRDMKVIHHRDIKDKNNQESLPYGYTFAYQYDKNDGSAFAFNLAKRALCEFRNDDILAHNIRISKQKHLDIYMKSIARNRKAVYSYEQVGIDLDILIKIALNFSVSSVPQNSLAGIKIKEYLLC